MTIVDGHWDWIVSGWGQHPANGRHHWTLETWRKQVKRRFNVIARYTIAIHQRWRHEVEAQSGTADEGRHTVWRPTRVLWHSIPAPVVRKDSFVVIHSDWRTLQRIRAMNEIATLALDEASADAVDVLDLWRLTLPLIDLSADRTHFDLWMPYREASLALLLERLCQGTEGAGAAL